jgi:hypothetical protein
MALVALTAADRSARADDEPCGPAAQAWAAACAGAGGGRVEASRCRAGHVVLSVLGPEGAPVFIDATSEGAALRQIHGVGLSPIGEFEDFETAPGTVREAFEHVAACVERDPTLPLTGEPTRVGTTSGRRAEAPWRLVAGLALGGVALSRRQRPRRSALRALAALVVLGVATLALAHFVAGSSFFHQNGHGPNWIGYALGDPCPYGPGFQELFGWAARLRPDAPESPVFVCNGVLAGTWPMATWIVARRVGARAPLAWAIALGLAVDPLLLRIAFTESYYVPITALILVGTAVGLSAPTLRSWSPRWLVASAASGLIAAEVARVHPIGWVAVAVIGLSHLARPGASTRRLRQAAIATTVIGAVVAATAGPAIVQVLAGEMGAHYLPELRRAVPQELPVVVAIAGAGAIAIALTRRWRNRWPSRLALLAVVLAAANAGTSLLSVDVDWIRAAHARMFLAPGVAAFVSILVPWVRREAYGRIAAGIAVVMGLAHGAIHASWAVDLPTDALELRLALSWRPNISPGTRLVTVEAAGVMAVQLPIYGDARGRLVSLDAQGPTPTLGSFGDRVFYYRSSLCSTAAARAWCDALEQTADLEPVDVHELPALPSTHAVTYEGTIVRVGLFRARPHGGATQLQ